MQKHSTLTKIGQKGKTDISCISVLSVKYLKLEEAWDKIVSVANTMRFEAGHE